MAAALPNKAPVVIIGGGIIGVSILYHLAIRNVPAVLLERKKIASGTTWHAAGIVGQLRESQAQTELGKYTAQLFHTLEKTTGQATGYRQNGTINIAIGDVRHEQLLRTADHAARVGVKAEMMSHEALCERWPLIRSDDVRSALFVPSNGTVNPLDVTMAMVKAAKQHGAEVFENTEALRVLSSNAVVAGVETRIGTIETAKVVLAGGIWSHRIAKSNGITLPLHAAEHWYIVTEPIPGLQPDLPVLNIVEERTYWKPDAGKLLIGGFEAQGKSWANDGVPDTFEFDELPFDMEHAEPELVRMFSRMPNLEDIGVRTFFNGPESFTPDGKPYLGPVSELRGMFVAAGMNSNGILNAGGVGLTMAEWMIDGAPKRSMGALHVQRAQPFQTNTRYNQQRSAESVGFHYGLSWPGRQVHSARGVRRVPLHQYHKGLGAAFAERIGWEVPMFFDRDARGWRDEPSLGWKHYSALVRQECIAARDDAVLLDQSMYAKYVVQGSDAIRVLNRVCGAQINIAVGATTYTQFLNDLGGIEADVTVLRTNADRFVVISGHPSQTRDQVWLHKHADPAWQYEVFDATSAYALLSIHGPKARSILASITGDDVSATAIGFGMAKEIDLAYARGWVIRRSFLGELGFELLVSTEFIHGIYEQLIAAGKPHGLAPMGMFAMNSCRIEKGFLHFGHDIGEDDTPLETGLGFAVDLHKSEDFLGKAALLRQYTKRSKLNYRTVLIKVDSLTAQAGPYLIHNEPVFKNNEQVGHVTSGDWGHRIDAMVGIGSLHRETGVDLQWVREGGFSVQIAGTFYDATVQLTPFYDPDGQRMRG